MTIAWKTYYRVFNVSLNIKKSLIQLQTEDNNLGTLVVVVHFDPIRYIYYYFKGS